MRFLAALPGFVLILALVALCLLNRDAVSFSYFPLRDPIDVPLYIPILGAMLFGFFLGALMVWIHTLTRRVRQWRIKKPAAPTKALIPLEPGP